jgi:hypothetical protein
MAADGPVLRGLTVRSDSAEDLKGGYDVFVSYLSPDRSMVEAVGAA